jgi:hypothetical protein
MRVCLCAVLVFALCGAAGRAQSQPVVRKNQPEKGYALRPAAVRASVWSDKGYAITLLPPALRGAQMLVRPAGAGQDWPDPRDYTATADCTVYLAVRNEFNGTTQFPEDKAKKLVAAGWAEVDEAFRTSVPKGENWKWRIFRKDIPKGKVELQPTDLQFGAMTLFLFGKKRD